MQQGGDRNADLLGKKQRDPGGHEQHEERDHGHEKQVEGAHVASRAGQFRERADRFVDLPLLFGNVDGHAGGQFDGALQDALDSDGVPGEHGLIGAGRQDGKWPDRIQRRVSSDRNDGRGCQILILGEALEKAGRLHALLQQQAGFGLRRQQSSLQLGFVAEFVLQGPGDLDKGLVRGFGRLAEPLVEVAVQHLVAEQHQKQGRRDAEGQGAEDQLGLDARAFAAAAPVDVQLHHRAHQHEAERDHEHEDQAGDGPEDEGLFRVRGPVFAKIEGTLPDYQRHRNRQQDDAADVEDSLSHLFEL